MKLNFDFRVLKNGIGVEVDSDLRLDLYEQGSDSLKESRVLGNDWNTQLLKASDSQGIFYVTRVDVSSYTRGVVTGKWYAHVTGTEILPYPTIETNDYPNTRIIDGVDLKDFVKAYLGAPILDVELHDSQYNQALLDTLDLYNRSMGTKRRGELTLLAGQNGYFLPDVGDRGVYEVQFTRADGGTYAADPFFGREFPYLQTMQNFDEYLYGISHLDSLKRVLGVEPEWDWDSYENKLWIDVGSSDLNVAYEKYKATYYWVEDTPLQRVPSYHRKWLKDYYLASCQEILGMIRSKYGGVVKAPGGDITMNGTDLLQRALERKRELEEQLKDMQPAVPPIRG